MPKPKRSSDEYIRLNKNITQKEIRNIIHLLAKDWHMTPQEVAYEFIKNRAIQEIEKRKK